MKITAIRIDESLKNLAYQSIVAQSIRNNCPPESFSSYVRRLIKEDIERTKKSLKKQ